MLIIKNIFLTGKINIGKSTAISKFIEGCIKPPYIIAGFKTVPFYEKGYLRGYYIQNQLPGSITDIKENMVGINMEFGKGKMCRGVTEIFESKGVTILNEALNTPNSIILMDELGFFEKEAINFREKVHEVLSSGHRVLGVIKEKSNEFLSSVSGRKDVKVISVTLENRDKIQKEIKKYWE
ncbi:nucleoside-triphosphatase [Clostridium polynesiense]|uniref:nucleoside-triphosphatase n=1 Tax=Clostridium polynesiense TaxID=1325933 RepID=UPI00058FADFB|nr:nucleoside-triphosphatase [Clostridium polynesiense]